MPNLIEQIKSEIFFAFAKNYCTQNIEVGSAGAYPISSW